MEKSNGELFSGMEQIHNARINLEADWEGGVVRLPVDTIEKKIAYAKQAKEDLIVIAEILEKFNSIAKK